MVAADDQMVQPWFLRISRARRLAGPPCAWPVQQAHGGGCGRVLVQHRLVAAHAGEVVDIARLGHADDRVDQQVGLGLFRGAEGQFLVRAVQRVAGLEGDDAAPAQLAE